VLLSESNKQRASENKGNNLERERSRRSTANKAPKGAGSTSGTTSAL
jgi:hypothetical protein